MSGAFCFWGYFLKSFNFYLDNCTYVHYFNKDNRQMAKVEKAGSLKTLDY